MRQKRHLRLSIAMFFFLVGASTLIGVVAEVIARC